MIVKTNITIYQCDHCKKKYFVKSACEKHEPFCSMNPENYVKCSGCIYFEEYKKEIYMDHPYGGEDILHRKSFRCNKKAIGMYPINVVRRGLLGRFPETFEGEMLMPKECDDYKYFYD